MQSVQVVSSNKMLGNASPKVANQWEESSVRQNTVVKMQLQTSIDTVYMQRLGSLIYFVLDHSFKYIRSRAGNLTIVIRLDVLERTLDIDTFEFRETGPTTFYHGL